MSQVISFGGASGSDGTVGSVNMGFKAWKINPSQNATGDNLGYVLIYDIVEFDTTGGGYNNTTGRFTAPINGIYYFSASVGLGGFASSTFTRISFVLQNTSFVFSGMRETIGGTNILPGVNSVSADVSGILELQQGQAVETVISVGGGTRTVVIETGENLTFLSGFLVQAL